MLKQLPFGSKETPKFRIQQHSVGTFSQENATKQTSLDFVTSEPTKVSSKSSSTEKTSFPKSTSTSTSTPKPTSTTIKSTSSSSKANFVKNIDVPTLKTPISSMKKSSDLTDDKNVLMEHPSCVNGEFKQDFKDEKSYFRCDDGSFHRHQCPGNSIWVHNIESCVLKNESPPFGCTHDNFYPDLTNCKAFYRCTNHRMKRFQCTGNLLWNQKLLTCDLPDKINWCDGLKPVIRYENTTKGNCNHVNDYMTGPSGQLFHCTNDLWTLGSCPPGSAWNKYFSACDYPFNNKFIEDPLTVSFEDFHQRIKSQLITTKTLDRVESECKIFEKWLNEGKPKSKDENDENDDDYDSE